MNLSKCLLMLLLAVLKSSECKRYWEYEVFDVYGLSPDESKIKLNFFVKRVGRDLAGFSGTVDWKYDLDNDTLFEVKFYQSTNGKDYHPVPFSVPRKPFKDLKRLYDDLIYINMKDCSNLPYFEGDSLLPWPKNVYTFNNCKFDKGNLPEVLSDGIYKYVFSFIGEVNWSVTFLTHVKTKLI